MCWVGWNAAESAVATSQRGASPNTEGRYELEELGSETKRRETNVEENSGQHLSQEMPLKAPSIFCNRDWQPEANRRTPLSTGDAT